jgi:hypothetical protein
VLYSSLIHDGTGDRTPDIVMVANGDNTSEYAMIFPLPRMTADRYRPRPPFSGEDSHPRLKTTQSPPFLLFEFGLHRQNEGRFVLPQDGLAGLMPEFEDYAAYMTKLSTDFSEASGLQFYNALYDMVFNSRNVNMRFPAPRLLNDNDYPNNGQNLRVPVDFSINSPELLTADLSTYDPSAIYQNDALDHVSHSFTDEELFKGSSLVSIGINQRIFDKPCFVKISGNLNLDLESRVSAPVVIVADGDIRVGKVEHGSPAGFLTLVSLNGNVHHTGEGLFCNVIAPAGTFTWDGELEMEGSLFVNELDALSISESGGQIQFHTEADPTVPANFIRGYTFVTGPRFEGGIGR